MKRLATTAVACALGLLGTGAFAAAPASADGYLTTLFSRGMHGAVAPGHVSMDAVKAYFDSRGLDATVSVVTQWPLGNDHYVQGGYVYLSWSELAALQADGWTITAHGRSGLDTEGASPAATNAEVLGSLVDLLDRGFNDAWSLYSYKSSPGGALAERLVNGAYAYGRINSSNLVTLTMPLAQPERATVTNTWGGHCRDASLACFDAAPMPYRLPSEVLSSINAMNADQWTLLQSYRFVDGFQPTGKVRFDCTGPETQHWAVAQTSSREVYCWNDYRTIIEGADSAIESPVTIASLYGRAIFSHPSARADAWPATLSFGRVNRGQVSPSKRLTFLNAGTAPLSVNSVRLSGTSPAEFRLTGDTCSGMLVPVTGVCTVDVAFAPTNRGIRNAAVTFAHTAAGSPLQVPVTGNGR